MRCWCKLTPPQFPSPIQTSLCPYPLSILNALLSLLKLCMPHKQVFISKASPSLCNKSNISVGLYPNFNQNLIVVLFSTTSGTTIFSSPEPKASWRAYSIPMLRRLSIVRRHPQFQTSSSLNHWANQSQILCGPSLGRGERKFVRGIMTKMVATPIYGKTLQKSSSLEPAGHFPCNLVCIIGSPVFSNDDPGVTLTYFMARSNLGFSIGINENRGFFRNY